MGKSSGARLLRDVAEVGLFALIIYLLITSAVETVKVYGISSYPNLMQGDILIASKIDYFFHPPQRGDFVIIKPPISTEDFIKRIIAVPGDRLLIRNSHVYIDGRRLYEPYLKEPWTINNNWPANPDSRGVLIPPNEYFVMGDNRNFSTDSRAFGLIARKDILAHAILRIWPPNRIGLLNAQPTFRPPRSAQDPVFDAAFPPTLMLWWLQVVDLPRAL